MSRFYADITGGRGTATRQGHAASGIRGHVRGWSSGVKVTGHAADTIDRFDIYVTSGSGGGFPDLYLGSVVDDEWHPAIGKIVILSESRPRR